MILLCRYPPPQKKKKNRAAMLRLLRKNYFNNCWRKKYSKGCKLFWLHNRYMYALHACPKCGMGMGYFYVFHQYVTYVLAGCLENIFWIYGKLGFFVRSNCYPCATVVRLIVCCVNTLCLSALPLFVHYPQGMCSDALTAHAGIVQGLYAA